MDLVLNGIRDSPRCCSTKPTSAYPELDLSRLISGRLAPLPISEFWGVNMSKYIGLNRYKSSLAAVAVAPLPETFDYNPEPTKPGRGRLRAVAPLEVPTQPAPIAVGSKGIVQEDLRKAEQYVSIGNDAKAARRLSFHRMTTEDFIQVKLATFREGTRHCFWPTDVLEKFLAADVITSPIGRINPNQTSD